MNYSSYLWDENNPEGYANRIGIYKKKIEFGFISKFIDPSITTIIDIGGGSGRIAHNLKNLNKDITIVDVNETAVSLAKERGLNAYCSDILYFNEIYKYDMAIAIESLDYIENKSVFFNKVYSLLNDNGYLIFTIPNIKSWRYILRHFKKRKTDYYHSTYYQYKRLIKDAGFDFISSEGFMWMPFKVNSNNRLIPAIQFIEGISGLKKFISQSPWIIISCKKIPSKINQ
jgi:SAM-dependent methyltransferase